MKINRILSLVVALIAASLAISLYISCKNKNVFSCVAKGTIYNNNSVLKSVIFLNINDTKGYLKIDGTLSSNDAMSTVGRIIDFKSSNTANNYFLTTENITETHSENINSKDMEKYLPQFYYRKGSTLRISINDEGNGLYLIYRGVVPELVCEARKNTQ